MTDKRQVIIIGGGIVGCSILYHLSRRGWCDSVLLERRKLTSGSTWHAAGNVTYFGHYPSITRLYIDSVTTYLAAERQSGQNIGFHATGSLRLAENDAQLRYYRRLAAFYETLNIKYSIVEKAEIHQLHPLLDTSGIKGAAYTPGDGHVDAVGATYAMAKAARQNGAEIRTGCHVENLHRQADGTWLVSTTDANFRAGHVVVATSFWARELLQPVGLKLPVYALEHHEIITESIAEIATLQKALPTVRDPGAPANVRQEGQGLLCGVYEANPRPWQLDGIPVDFGEELLENDLPRLTPHLEKVIARLPVFGQAGIKAVHNGPICYTPDGLPLLGPVEHLPGLWLATGFCIGIGTGGGAGSFISDWLVNGRPPMALPAVHPQRFAPSLSQKQAIQSIIKTYAMGYALPDYNY